MLNRPRQIDYFLGSVAKVDGTALANGVVVAYVADARDLSGQRVFKRAAVFRDSTGQVPFTSSEMYLDANGRVLDSPGGSDNVPVYGEGSYLLLFFADTADMLTGEENDPAIYASYMASPTADRQEIFHASHEIVNARHFGAQGDANATVPGSGTDDTAALQAALDYCLGADSVTRPRVLFIPAGTYRITSSLKIMTPGVGGAIPTNLYPCSIHIHGEKELPEGTHPDTIIYCESMNLPAIMIQAGHGIIIRNIGIYGINRFDFTFGSVIQANTNAAGVVDYATAYGAFLDDNFYYYNWPVGVPTYLHGKCRDTSQSPYAAIVIDPFSPEGGLPSGPPGGIPTSNQYPGFAGYYKLTSGTPYSYSTAVLIEGCSIGRFAVGVMISPTGKAANAENIVIRHTQFEICRVAVAIGQNQTRGLNVENCSGYLLNTFVDNRSYGAGIEGAPPNIRGLAVSQVKYLFNLEMGASVAAFEQIYAEASLSLGFLGVSQNVDQHNVAFVGCDFNFNVSRPMIDVHFYGFAGLMFNSCMFTLSGAQPTILPSASPPIRFANFAPIVFENCRLNSGRITPGDPVPGYSGLDIDYDSDWLNGAPQWGFHEPTLVTYRGVGHLDNYKDLTAAGNNDTGSADPRNGRVTFLRQDYPRLEGTTAERLSSNLSLGMLRQYLPPGATIGPTGGAAGSTAYLRRVSGAMNRILLPVDANGYTRFYLEPPDVLFFDGLAGQIMVGDVVYIPGTDGSGSWPVYVYGKAMPGSTAMAVLKSQLVPPMAEGTFPVGCPIGAVTKVDVGRNYIYCAPRSLVDLIKASGVYDASVGYSYLNLRTGCIQRFGRYHPATLGTWTAPTNVLTVTFPDTSFALNQVWKKGDRITTDELDGSGNPVIPRGTYILGTQTSPDRILLSKTLTASGTNARLFDADVLRVALTAE